jgi:hypothetical protein
LNINPRNLGTPRAPTLSDTTRTSRAWWHEAFVRLPSLRYTERHVTTSNDRVFLG